MISELIIKIKSRGCEKMKRINIFMLILSMILFLGILYDESQLIMLDFDNMSRRGFLNSEKIYYTERDMIAKSFTSYDEIITKAKTTKDLIKSPLSLMLSFSSIRITRTWFLLVVTNCFFQKKSNAKINKTIVTTTTGVK